jgi:hypothetical protein
MEGDQAQGNGGRPGSGEWRETRLKGEQLRGMEGDQAQGNGGSPAAAGAGLTPAVDGIHKYKVKLRRGQFLGNKMSQPPDANFPLGGGRPSWSTSRVCVMEKLYNKAV